jgi:hypothetical protein
MQSRTSDGLQTFKDSCWATEEGWKRAGIRRPRPKTGMFRAWGVSTWSICWGKKSCITSPRWGWSGSGAGAARTGGAHRHVVADLGGSPRV